MTDVETDKAPSYHDVYITTKDIPRTSIFDLPYGLELSCNRVGGWSLWDHGIAVGSEYEAHDKGLIVDIAGHVIVDSLTPRKKD